MKMSFLSFALCMISLTSAQAARAALECNVYSSLGFGKGYDKIETVVVSQVGPQKMELFAAELVNPLRLDFYQSSTELTLHLLTPAANAKSNQFMGKHSTFSFRLSSIRVLRKETLNTDYANVEVFCSQLK